MKTEDLKTGDRILFKCNGVQQAGTVIDYGRINPDLNGWYCNIDDEIEIIRKLEGLEACRAGDIILDKNGDECKILEIGNSHTATLISYSSDDAAWAWSTFEELIDLGYTLKNQEEEKEELIELTLDEIAKKLDVDVEKLRIKE